MNNLDFGWLIPTLITVVGAALLLISFSFAYEAALRERKPITKLLAESKNEKLLAAGGALCALGIVFMHTCWAAKGSAVIIAIMVNVLAWKPQREQNTYRARIQRQKPSAKSFAILLINIWLWIFITLFAIWGVHLGWHAYHLYRLAREVQNSGSQLQVDAIPTLIGGAAEHISTIHRELQPLFPITNALHWLPTIGSYLGQVDPLLTYANSLALAGDEIIMGVQPLLEASGSKNSDLSLTELACQVLETGKDHFKYAAEELEKARVARSRINPDLLPGSVKLLFIKFDERFDLLVAGGQLLQLAPTLLGSEQPQNYLVLAQNRDELRATGGFISGIGLATLKDGKITQFTLGDSYAVDDFTKPYPAPPQALKDFMMADYWVPRDGNWSPDFPTAARQVQELYTLSTGIETQGVIAFNQLAVQSVLQVIGAVQITGVDESVTFENVENYMRQAWAPAPEEGLNQEWWLHRKDFMQQLGNVIIEKALSSENREQLIKLAEVLFDLLGRKQVLVYFNDEPAQLTFGKIGLDGAISPGDGDYLYLVDSNVGFNKVDSVINRSLHYQVDLSDIENPIGTVTLTYQHSGTDEVPCVQVASYGSGTYRDMQQRCYWDYWRLYTPIGAQFLESNSQPVSSDQLLNKKGWSGQVERFVGENNTQVFSGLLVLPVANSSQVEVSYILPPSIIKSLGNNQSEYSLKIDVQPGLQGISYEVTIVLPTSTQISSADEGFHVESGNSATWSGILQKPIDLQFILVNQ